VRRGCSYVISTMPVSGALQEVSIHYIAHVIGTMKGRTSQAHVYGSYLLRQDLMESAFAQDVMSC
jgi:hypothetical protein